MRAPLRLPFRVVRPALVRAAALPVLAVVPALLPAQGAPHVAAHDVPMAHAAQGAAAPAHDAAARPALRVVGAYTVANARGGFPVAFTVADSAGRLVARYRMAGDASDRPMSVDVAGADLVLEASTADGPLSVVLEGQNEATAARAGRLTGRWQYRGATGVLRGEVRR